MQCASHLSLCQLRFSFVSFSQSIPLWKRRRCQLRTVTPTSTETLDSTSCASAPPELPSLDTGHLAATPLNRHVTARVRHPSAQGEAEADCIAATSAPADASRSITAAHRLAAQDQQILLLQQQLPGRSKRPWPRRWIAVTTAAGPQRPRVLAPPAPAPPTVAADTWVSCARGGTVPSRCSPARAPTPTPSRCRVACGCHALQPYLQLRSPQPLS